ncbi:unnamed protein product [Linum trigynum]|uniref:Uncharacterized protein n=1 Tax=Linum trigynum TaxID=586398 RepID=A0AAV2DHA4_9ROSI
MGEGRSQQPQQPPPPSPPQAAVLSVMVEPYAPYQQQQQQQHPAPHCYGDHHHQQINMPNAFAYGAPATPYPGHPRQMMNSSVTVNYPVVEADPPLVVDRLPCCGIGIGWFL